MDLNSILDRCVEGEYGCMVWRGSADIARKARRIFAEASGLPVGNEDVVNLCGNRLCVHPDHQGVGGRSKLKTMNDDDRRTWLFNNCEFVEGGCWNWTGSRHPTGYPIVAYRGKPYRGNRLSLELFMNINLTGLMALHHCDNPACINPHHLYAGTARDNSRDMNLRSRRNDAFGEGHPKNKLTEHQVREVYARKASGESTRAISRDYGVTDTTVNSIASRKIWKHLDFAINDAPINRNPGG